MLNEAPLLSMNSAAASERGISPPAFAVSSSAAIGAGLRASERLMPAREIHISHLLDSGTRSREGHALGRQDSRSRPTLGKEAEEHVLRLDLPMMQARGFRMHGAEPSQVVVNGGHRHLLRVGANPG